MIQLGLVVVGLLLSAASLASEFLGFCGSCGAGEAHRAAIAAAGSVGYAALIFARCTGLDACFHSGTVAAAAVHTALLVWMLIVGPVCALCLIAAIAAIGNAVVGHASGAVVSPLLERVYVPVLLVASGVSFAIIARDGSDEARRANMARRETASSISGAARTADAPLRIVIYENAHCGYCQEFRDRYAPSLDADFGSRVKVEYRDSSSSSWVRRTPTIAIEGGALFEGLPVRYEDLQAAVAAAWSHTK
jgi:protein-disulfide isomerase